MILGKVEIIDLLKRCFRIASSAYLGAQREKALAEKNEVIGLWNIESLISETTK